jgi:hypothetical protein
MGRPVKRTVHPALRSVLLPACPAVRETPCFPEFSRGWSPSFRFSDMRATTPFRPHEGFAHPHQPEAPARDPHVPASSRVCHGHARTRQGCQGCPCFPLHWQNASGAQRYRRHASLSPGGVSPQRAKPSHRNAGRSCRPTDSESDPLNVVECRPDSDFRQLRPQIPPHQPPILILASSLTSSLPAKSPLPAPSPCHCTIPRHGDNHVVGQLPRPKPIPHSAPTP